MTTGRKQFSIIHRNVTVCLKDAGESFCLVLADCLHSALFKSQVREVRFCSRGTGGTGLDFTWRS